MADYDRLAGYKAPTERFLREWAAEKEALAGRIAEARAQGKFILGGWISIFERLQFLRGTEDLYCDIALEEGGMFAMMDLVMDFMRVIWTPGWRWISTASPSATTGAPSGACSSHPMPG